MDVVLFLFGGAGAVWGLVAFTRYQARVQQQDEGTRRAGLVAHRRSGEYPSSCSWCKNTALAKKLFVFHRSDGEWKPEDVIARLQICTDEEVHTFANVLVSDLPSWRRFCSEKCARESFRSDHIESVEAFGACEYCSVRFPMALIRCPNCGAGRVSR